MSKVKRGVKKSINQIHKNYFIVFVKLVRFWEFFVKLLIYYSVNSYKVNIQLYKMECYLNLIIPKYETSLIFLLIFIFFWYFLKKYIKKQKQKWEKKGETEKGEENKLKIKKDKDILDIIYFLTYQ